MATRSLLCLVLALQFGDYVTGLSTDPPTENGGTAVVAALENATNVSVFCAVTFQGTPVHTGWYLTEQGGTRQQILFGLPSAANYFTSENTSYIHCQGQGCVHWHSLIWVTCLVHSVMKSTS